MEDFAGNEIKRFNYLTGEIDYVYHEAALRLGLSDSAMMILYTVCNNGGECLISDITRMSVISKQTVNSALRRLEGENIVYLEKFNGKMKKICLTDKGRELVKNTVVKIIDIENGIFDSWSVQERELYLTLTEKYLVSFREKIKNL